MVERPLVDHLPSKLLMGRPRQFPTKIEVHSLRGMIVSQHTMQTNLSGIFIINGLKHNQILLTTRKMFDRLVPCYFLAGFVFQMEFT